ncbi:hypothetical protein D3C84_1109980 [compost metagenome]
MISAAPRVGSSAAAPGNGTDLSNVKTAAAISSKPFNERVLAKNFDFVVGIKFSAKNDPINNSHALKGSM